MADEEMTLSEIARSLRRIEANVTGSLAKIEANFVNFVNREVYEARHEALEDRVNDLEESKKAYARLLVGAILAAIVPSILLLFKIKVAP